MTIWVFMMKIHTAIAVTPAGLIATTDLVEDSGLVLQAAVCTNPRDWMATRQRICITLTEKTDPTLSCCLHAFE